MSKATELAFKTIANILDKANGSYNPAHNAGKLDAIDVLCVDGITNGGDCTALAPLYEALYPKARAALYAIADSTADLRDRARAARLLLHYGARLDTYTERAIVSGEEHAPVANGETFTLEGSAIVTD